MNKTEAIAASKQFRKGADALLQRMKEHTEKFKNEFTGTTSEETASYRFENRGEVIANHILSVRDLESAIMRQGLVLKNIGTPNPYPESYNPESSVVEPTADGLTL